MLPRSNRLVVITYHRVIEDPVQADFDEIGLRQFRMHVDLYSRYFNVLRLTEAASLLQSRRLPSRAMCITFDDGYRDNVTAALPILMARGLPATFFVATGYLDGGIMWNDIVIESLSKTKECVLDLEDKGLGIHRIADVRERRDTIASVLSELKYRGRAERERLCRVIAERANMKVRDDLMMRTADLIRLRDAGMELGGHTRNHPILSVATDDESEADILAGKNDIEKVTHEEVRAFAYPNGRPGRDYDSRHVGMVRKLGFRTAVTTAPGYVDDDSDVLQLGRFSMWHRSRTKFMLRLMLNYYSGKPTVV